MSTKTAKGVNFKELTKGEVLSETQFYKVEKIKEDKCQLVNTKGDSVVLDRGYVESCLVSASQYGDVANISKTEATELVLSKSNTAMTINFNKQVKEADVTKEILDAYEGSNIKTMETAIKKAVKKALAGEERTIIGYHTGTQDSFGRINFTDMNAEGHNLRLVDTRSINWVIVNGVKYTVK